MHPVAKLHSLRGLRIVTLVAGLAVLLSAILLVLAIAWSARVDLSDDGAFWCIALLVMMGALGFSVWLASILAALSETVFKIGLTHMPALVRRAGIPVLIGTGIASGVSCVLVLGEMTNRWTLEPVTMALPLIGMGSIALAVAGLGAAYSVYVMRLRARRVDGWRARLDDYRDRFPASALARLTAFVESETDARPAHVPARGAFFPGVSSRTFHDDLSLHWMQELEGAFEAIRREIIAVVDERTSLSQHYPGNRLWKTFKLVDNGRKVEENCARCPVTSEILSRVPSEGEVMISLLEPGARIATHLDFSAPMLTYHLAIQVPPKCGIRVGGETREWVEGRSFVLDTTYEHEAWNDSEQVRIVLIVDFPHPELSPVECDFFCKEPYVEAAG